MSLCMALVLCVTSPTLVAAQSPTSEKVAPAQVAPSQTKVLLAPAAPPKDIIGELLPRLGEPVDLTTKERGLVKQVVVAVRKNVPSAADGPWKELVESQFKRRGSAVDVAALVQLVLRGAYLETSGDLRRRANKLSTYNEVRRHLRDHVSDRRADLLDLENEIDTVTVQTVTLVTKGNTIRLIQGRRVAMTRAQLIEYIDELQEMLSSIADDADLMTLRLQDALQKQQQSFHMLSNILKSQHDTAKAIIQNLRG